jgi:hypothetical protein
MRPIAASRRGWNIRNHWHLRCRFPLRENLNAVFIIESGQQITTNPFFSANQ